MFDSPEFPQSLDETLFNTWLEIGRKSRIPYAYLLIVWDEIEGNYLPFFAENRSEIEVYEKYGGDSPARQLLVAAFNLYSESRVF